MAWKHSLGRIGRLVCALVSGGLMIAAYAPAAQAQSFEVPSAVSLPKDEAPHHSQVEWWYFVGHLNGVDAKGVAREFGYEVTVFQVWPLPLGPATYSWHFALTDVNNNKFRYEERANSATIPTTPNSFSFQNGDWSIAGSQQNYALKARLFDNRYRVDLQTSSAIPFTIHGANGVVPYTPLSDVSAYYSSTALTTTGVVYDNGVPIQVTGTSWQDRQWYNVKGNGGWNWFSIQLNNNTQYMIYYLQDPTGNIVNKFGTRVVNGVSSPIAASGLGLTVLSHWISPTSLYPYPSKWAISVPEGTMTVTPLVQNQELVWPAHRTYFEGDSSVTGTLNGQAVTGRGYAEVNPSFEPLASLP